MSTAPMPQAPAIPPRYATSADADAAGGLMPKVPPRPGTKTVNRSISPNRDRFAPSPLMQGIPAESMNIGPSKHHMSHQHSSDPIERSRSVDLPSVGEEGMEYGAVADELSHDEPPSAPEQARLLDKGLTLHAPKPSLPASSAKKQVMAVTRTDSDKAAAFGIGQPSSHREERTVSQQSMRKRPTSSYSTCSDQGNHTDDDRGIPEIGQRVPMNKHLGDVQAPSPGPGHESPKSHHVRKHSARSLPPGSYGLHGHGVAPKDKLGKAYYEKHPEALQREQHTPHHDRQNDYAMSSTDLNKLVRDSASRQAVTGSSEVRGTPTDDVAFEATEKYTSRISSSRPSSVVTPSASGAGASQSEASEDDKGIHVDDGKNPEFCHYGEDSGEEDKAEDYSVPILASDEVGKDPNPRGHKPAIRPHLQRHGSSYDGEDPPPRPASRSKTPHHSSTVQEHKPTPLEDVEEYDPLFPEDGKEATVVVQEPEEEHCERNHFPSKDVWEDAPNSVHVTAEVSTPEVPEPEKTRSSAHQAIRPITPAHAFALYQEELAEKEANGRTNNYLPLQDSRPPWVGQQPHLQTSSRPTSSSKRFPSRDVWEDTPESHIHEAEVSASPIEQARPEIPARPAKKSSPSPELPAVPARPTGRQNSGDDATKKPPPVSEKPKPSVPPRPSKSSSGDSKDGASSSKPKPPVPSKSVGGKIAALQAGFMSDLNKRLQLGPQGVKKEEPKEEEPVEEQEKAPLVDARKSRARGPQRRAPAAKSTATSSSSSPEAASAAPVLSFSMPQTVWSVRPEDGDFLFTNHEDKISPDEVKTYEAPEASAPSENGPPASTSKQDPVPESKKELDPSEPPSVPVATRPAVAPDELRGQPAGLHETATAAKNEGKSHDGGLESLTLATNTAGESILEADVEKKGDLVEPAEVHDDVVS
ncbi:hypothetical protein E4U52_003212 [Claviceps spartinae]|nr:hypothetical protein E4U52_003212 [Claviceps spartinae]